MRYIELNKNILSVFVYSILVKIMVCFTQSSAIGVSYISFPLGLMLFTILCIDRYNTEKSTSKQIVLSILVGTLMLTIPIRILHFKATIGSLPEEILGVAGICSGWLVTYFKKKIWLLLLVMLVFISVAHYLPR